MNDLRKKIMKIIMKIEASVKKKSMFYFIGKFDQNVLVGTLVTTISNYEVDT